MQGDENDPPTLPVTPRDHMRTGPTDLVEPTKALDGYAFGDVIGKGGIGEIVAAHDLRIGRDVAIKRLRTKSPSEAEVNRFLREARIQARLEHPAIPPVHELGHDSDGRPYFAMKRLAGRTLAELVTSAEHNRPRLLRAFVEVCQAIDFSHARGVVHRDLKPSNIILGNFGEVYVLDWGLARVVGEAVAEVVTDDIESLDIKTGDLLGTPGYMAPEQLQKAAEAGRLADIYALGSILFELLAGEPLHPRGPNALPSTVGGEAVTSPAKRRPDRHVPPELDAIAVSMLLMDPAARPTAKRVAERVEAYLDGDRDVARRKTMANDLVWTARALIDQDHRADAMRTAGRALALDPESSEAAQLVSALVLEPPKAPSPELRRVLDEAEAEGTRNHAKTAAGAYLAITSFLFLTMWNGVRYWDIVLPLFGTAAIMTLCALAITRRPRPGFPTMLAYLAGNIAMIVLFERMAGPFTFVPALGCVMVMSLMAWPHFTQRAWFLIVVLALAFLVPLVLENLGHLEATWHVEEGALVYHPRALFLAAPRTPILLVLASMAIMIVAGIDAARILRANREARIQLVTQAWHLRQLLPR
jgi:serine/threonine-protein kinase